MSDNEQWMVDCWNAWFDIGTEVTVTMDNGEQYPTRTRSMACLMGRNTAVIWLDGMSSCYRLSRVKPRPPPHDHEQMETRT